MVTGTPPNSHMPVPSLWGPKSVSVTWGNRWWLSKAVWWISPWMCERGSKKDSNIKIIKLHLWGQVFYGGVPGPARSPASLCRAGCFRCCGYNVSLPSLLSGPDSHLFVTCWLGRSLKCVKASGSGRKDNAWETAVRLVVDINFVWIWAPMKSWLLNELHWSKRVIVGYHLGYWHQKTDNPKLSIPKPQWMHERKRDLKVKPVLLPGKLRIGTVLLVCTNMAFFFSFSSSSTSLYVTGGKVGQEMVSFRSLFLHTVKGSSPQLWLWNVFRSQFIHPTHSFLPVPDPCPRSNESA